MRGTLLVAGHLLMSPGIIPAHAGNTKDASDDQIQREDHPRACGEHQLPAVFHSQRQGSSPRMRGTPSACPSRSVRRRIIPAHAGNTERGAGSHGGLRDHPRACGEHSISPESMGRPEGSSPRMRGTLSDCRLLRNGMGIIPAHAGNTDSKIPLTVSR